MISSFVGFSALDLRDFARVRGWVLVPEALDDGLFVLNNPNFSPRQLVFANDESAPDYHQSLQLAAQTLAETSKVSLERLVSLIEEVHDDTVRFRLFGDNVDGTYLPLSFTTEALIGARNLLLSAAHSVLSPQPYHPRMSRSEALEFVNKAVFRHTEVGSFVFKVSCSVTAVETQPSLPLEETGSSFVRRSMMAVSLGAHQLVSAIQADTLESLVSPENVRTSFLSSNFCEALLRFNDDHLHNSLELGFNWSATLPQPQERGIISSVKISTDYFKRIEEVAQALRSSERERLISFGATVEQLNGDLNGEGQRSGEVILRLQPLDFNEESTRARVVLNADAYKQAIRAHMTPGSYLLLDGILRSGRQPRTLLVAGNIEIYFPGGGFQEVSGQP